MESQLYFIAAVYFSCRQVCQKTETVKSNFFCIFASKEKTIVYMKNFILIILCVTPFFAFSQNNTSAIPDSLKTEQDELAELKARYGKYYTKKKEQAQAKKGKKETYVWKKGKTTQDFNPSKKVQTTSEKEVSYARKPEKKLTKKGGATVKKNDAWKKKLNKGLKPKTK